MAMASGVFSTAFLYAIADIESTIVAAAFTVLVGFSLLYSFRRRRGIRAKPQFTRQSMRERSGAGSRSGSGTDAADQQLTFGKDDGETDHRAVSRPLGTARPSRRVRSARRTSPRTAPTSSVRCVATNCESTAACPTGGRRDGPEGNANRLYWQIDNRETCHDSRPRFANSTRGVT